MMIRPPVTMRRVLWIVLLSLWGTQRGTVEGAPHPPDTSIGGVPPAPRLDAGKGTEHGPPHAAQRHKFQDLVKSWHKGPDEADDRYPMWNPLLVGLIRGYLASQKTEKVGIIKEFQYLSNDMTGTSPRSDSIAEERDMPKRNKKLKLQDKDLKSKHRNDKRVKREVYQGEHGLLTERQLRRAQTLSAGSDVLVAGEEEQRLFYDTAEDLHEPTDFNIPLHDPRDQPLDKDLSPRRNKLGSIFHPFNQIVHHQRMKRDTYDTNYPTKSYYANNDNGYSSYPKFSDPFHPLAYPMKGSSYSSDARSRKSVIYPFDSATSLYDDQPFYERKSHNNKRSKQMKGSAKNFDFFERPYRSSSSRYSGNHFGSSSPKFSRNSYGNSGLSRNHFGASSSFSGNSFGSSNSDYGFPSFSETPSFSNFGNGYNNQKSLFSGDAKTSLNGLSSNVDLTSLAALYGNLFRNTAANAAAAGDAQPAVPRVNPVAQTPAIDTRRVDPVAAPTVPMPIVTAPIAVPPVTPAMATAVPVTFAPITLAVSTNPCDAFFTSQAPGGFTTRSPCYYVPRTDATTTGRPTTTPCLDTHGTDTAYPHYHPTHSPPSYGAEGEAGPAWSEFEIISQGLWDGDPHRATVTSPRPTLLGTPDRRFLITAPPTASRYITSPSPYDDGLLEDNKISPEILDLTGQFYPSAPQKAPQKAPRITGTIELKREKNKKPSYLVKLPFDTGKLPFAIRRLILSRFTDWPRTKGARNLASVTMDPLCPPGNVTCAQRASLSGDGKALGTNVDIIAEVDPALFDKERLRQAILQASSSRTQSALDLEEMEPSLRRHLVHPGEELGPRGLSEGDAAHPATRYLQLHEPLGAEPTGYQDDDDVNGENGLGQLSEEGWQKMMSPSTSNPLWSGANELPSETPGWLRGIINRFTKEKKWGKDGNEGDGVPRLLPALEGHGVDNHIETLPNPLHLRESSGTHRQVAGVVHWWILLAFILSYLVY